MQREVDEVEKWGKRENATGSTLSDTWNYK